MSRQAEKGEARYDQISLRVTASLKNSVNTAAKAEGISTPKWVRQAIEEKLLFIRSCPVCKTVNAPDAEYCKNCGEPLTEEGRDLWNWLHEQLEIAQAELLSGATKANQPETPETLAACFTLEELSAKLRLLSRAIELKVDDYQKKSENSPDSSSKR